MSGVEASLVLGIIAAVITIIDTTKRVCDAASNVHGLPAAFEEVAGRLPIVQNILRTAHQQIEAGEVDEETCKGMQPIVEACKEKAERLGKLFEKLLPAGDARRMERYRKAVKTIGKGSRVESLMKGMLVDVQLLASDHGIKTATKAEVENIAKAITEVSALPPSTDEQSPYSKSYTNINEGEGTVISQQGEGVQFNSTGSGKVLQAQTMHVGGDTQIQKNRLDIHTINVSNHSHRSGGTIKDDETDCLSALWNTNPTLTNPAEDQKTYIDKNGSRVGGTCEWIRKNEVYKLWLRGPSQLLWVSGGPGQGKTMLSIFLAEELQQLAEQSHGDVLVLKYFCDNKHERRNSAVSIVRSLIHQLLQKRPKLISHILEIFKIQRENYFAESSLGSLWTIYEAMVRDASLDVVYCIIDGLDECDSASMEVLVRRLRAFYRSDPKLSATSHLKLVAISREQPEFLARELSDFPCIRLHPEGQGHVSGDISKFIKVKVDELARYRNYPILLRSYVYNVLQNRAQGTFLWIGIVANELMHYTCDEVKDALERFPPGLDELYRRMLLQIPLHRRETTAKILRWVTMCVRPLKLLELGAAVGAAAESSLGLEQEAVIREQVTNCGSMLAIVVTRYWHGPEVGLIHQSAKDYLLRESWDPDARLEFFRIKKEGTHEEIVEKCLDCLESVASASEPGSSSRDQQNMEENPLHSYASRHWTEHARCVLNPRSKIFDVSLPFYADPSPAREKWLEQTSILFPKSWPMLHVASHFNILLLVERLLETHGSQLTEAIINLSDIEGNTALHIAAELGHEDMVRLLLRRGADPNISGKQRLTPLQLAVRNSKQKVTQLLLEGRANPDIRRGKTKSPLFVAAGLRQQAMVRLLLDGGADLYAGDYGGWDLIQEARTSEDEETVQLLLERGRRLNASQKAGGFILHWAANRGFVEVVRLLLELGADVNVGAEDPVLHEAAGFGNEPVVNLLLLFNADFTTKDSCGRTALQLAVMRGLETAVRRLLTMGADPNTQDDEGRIPIHEAVSNQNETVVRLLAEHSADVNVKNKWGETVLHAAVRNGEEGMVRLLLDMGAQPEITDKYGSTALHHAAGKGSEHVLQLLLIERVDIINFSDDRGRTALHHAVDRGREEVMRSQFEKQANSKIKDSTTAVNVVRLLLDKRADLEIKDKYGTTALDQAAEEGLQSIVQLLLEKGANPNIQDNNGRSPLHKAAERGHQGIVQLLLGRGANPMAKEVHGWTVLFVATALGQTEIQRLLLDHINLRENEDGWTEMS